MNPSGPRARPNRLLRAFHPATILAIGLTLTPASSLAGDIIDRMLAVVSGEVITQSDVRGALAIGLVTGADAADPVEAGLRELIDRTLMLAEVRRFAPSEPGAQEIEARIEQMRRRFGTPAAMSQSLAASGIDEERLRRLARDDLRLRAYLAERFAGSAQPTEPEVEQYVRERQNALVRDGQSLSLEKARDAAREQLAGERRQALVENWIADLRRRADITELYPPRP